MLPRRRLLRAASAAPVLLGGCVAPAAGERVEGFYSWGFEESAFEPCGRAERWWVLNDAALVRRYREVADRDYEPVYAELRGLLSEPGAYGQGGGYDREFTVTRVLAVRPEEAASC